VCACVCKNKRESVCERVCVKNWRAKVLLEGLQNTLISVQGGEDS